MVLGDALPQDDQSEETGLALGETMTPYWEQQVYKLRGRKGGGGWVEGVPNSCIRLLSTFNCVRPDLDGCSMVIAEDDKQGKHCQQSKSCPGSPKREM